MCKSSSIDRDKNNISLLEVLEKVVIKAEMAREVVAPDKPFAFPPSFQIVSFWFNSRGQERKVEVKLTIVDPNGKELFKKSHELVFKSGIRRMRSRVLLDRLLVTKSGDYFFNIYLKDKGVEKFKKVVSIPLEVKFTKRVLSGNGKVN